MAFWMASVPGSRRQLSVGTREYRSISKAGSILGSDDPTEKCRSVPDPTGNRAGEVRGYGLRAQLWFGSLSLDVAPSPASVAAVDSPSRGFLAAEGS